VERNYPDEEKYPNMIYRSKETKAPQMPPLFIIKTVISIFLRTQFGQNTSVKAIFEL